MKYHEAYEAHLKGQKVEMQECIGSWRETAWSKDIGYYHDKNFRIALKQLTEETPWVHSWAKFRAIDKNGVLDEFEHEQRKNSSWYGADYGLQQWSDIGYDTTNWETSKQERPRKKRWMRPEELWGRAVQNKDGDWFMVRNIVGGEIPLPSGCHSVVELKTLGYKWAHHPSAEVNDSFEVDEWATT